jgi:hypothetical protein
VGTNGDIYLSTEGNFSVSGSNGDGADIVKCTPGAGVPGACTFAPGLFWNASAHGLGKDSANNNALVDAIFLGSLDGDCSSFANGGFESQFLCWTTIQYGEPEEGLWRPSTAEMHTGLSSAEGRIERIAHAEGGADLISSPFSVDFNHAYRFHFWGKGTTDVPGDIYVDGYVRWYEGSNYQETSIGLVDMVTTPNWTEVVSEYLCPPNPNVTAARVVFYLNGITLQQVTPTETGSIFIDDVSWESQSSLCPLSSQP